MLKTISAALVAVSVLAAPALAGTPGKTAQAPVNKTTQAPVIKAEQGKAEGAERQCQDGPPSQALSASSPPQAHRLAQDACEAHRGQARDAGRKTQLNLIRRRAFRPHCPARACE